MKSMKDLKPHRPAYQKSLGRSQFNKSCNISVITSFCHLLHDQFTVPRCDGEIATKTRETGELGDEIQLLQASIESSEAAVSGHEEKLQSVAMDMAKWSAQKELLGLQKGQPKKEAMDEEMGNEHIDKKK